MFYDIITAKEKQAAPKETFVFHAVINEKAFDEVKRKVRQHELSSLNKTAKEKQATQRVICFSCAINEKAFDEVKQRARQRVLSSFVS